MTAEQFAKEVSDIAGGRYASARVTIGINGARHEWYAFVMVGDDGIGVSSPNAKRCLTKFRKALAARERGAK